MISRVLFIFSVSTLSGCAVTRAESNYELNRLAGETTPGDKNEDSFNFRTNSNLPKKPYMPVRVPPVVERVWLTDRRVGDYWQQGTWIWIEVKASRWLNEIDPGGAPFFLP